MTGLVLLAQPPDDRHLRLGLRAFQRSSGPVAFWDQRGLGVVRLATAGVPPSLWPRTAWPGRPGTVGRRLATAFAGQPPGDQDGADGPAGVGRRGEPLRLGDSPPLGRTPRLALPSPAAGAMEEDSRRHAGNPRRRRPAAGFDASRRRRIASRGMAGRIPAIPRRLCMRRAAMSGAAARVKSRGSFKAGDRPSFAPPASGCPAGIDVRDKMG